MMTGQGPGPGRMVQGAASQGPQGAGEAGTDQTGRYLSGAADAWTVGPVRNAEDLVVFSGFTLWLCQNSY
jgi:hypothetical protein